MKKGEQTLEKQKRESLKTRHQRLTTDTFATRRITVIRYHTENQYSCFHHHFSRLLILEILRIINTARVIHRDSIGYFFQVNGKIGKNIQNVDSAF